MTPGTTSIFNSLRFRLIASVVTIEIIMLSLLVWNNISIIQTTHTDRLRDTAASMLQQIANTSGNYMMAVDYATLEDYLSNIISYKELSYIVVLDRDDNAVITLGDAPSPPWPQTDTHPAQVSDNIYDVAKDIDVADLSMGRLLMGFSLSLMDNAIDDSRNRGITIAAIEIILTVIVTVLIGLGFTRRLGVLANAAAEVEAGDYSVTVPTETDDEVGKTAHAFNRMVAEISSRTRQLKKEEKITQQLLAENRLLIQKSLEVQEEERKNLARELHDELGQCITAIQADAESIRDLSTQDDKRINISANAILNVSAHIYDVVHSMMHLLRPSVLDNLGLVEALKDEIDAWSKRNPKTSCIHSFEGDLSDLGEHTNITIYRIVQECLTNITKHAHATHVNIKLVHDSDKLHLLIDDDGVGMDVKSSNRGLGLIGMRERIQALDGVFFYETSPDDGFRVSIHIPHDNHSES
ncbi:MAG TPA: HAMP domain-containing protein [Gammaproteobacteria bacterium]|nr:HAMP domain-containing protein [Gammaproteobacteria bacterium]